MTHGMKCPDCGTRLILLPESSEPEGLRTDTYCSRCDQRFMSTKACLVRMRLPARDEDLKDRRLLDRHYTIRAGDAALTVEGRQLLVIMKQAEEANAKKG